MAHGLPDWLRTQGTLTTFQVKDLGEAAARLGSIVTFDRRGDVIWLDSFESGLAMWQRTAQGTGSSIAMSQDRARNGANSVLITAGDNSAVGSLIQHRQPIPVFSDLGLEVSAHFPGAIRVIDFLLVVRDGTNQQNFTLRYSDEDNELQFGNSSNTLTAFDTGVSLTTEDTAFHTFKFVVDPLSGEYVRAIVNDTPYDLSGNSGFSSSSSAAPLLLVRVTLFSRNTQNDQAYIDDVILTQNEP